MRVLISGASRGLGLVVADHYLKGGHEVTTIGRSKPLLTCKHITLDFTDLKGWDGALPEVDAVIHCAGGGLGLRGPLLTAQAFYDLFMTNLGGQAEINRLVLPAMMNDRKGYIVHVCSIASNEAIGSVGYNTVKASLAAYVRSLGREMAPHNVIITGIAPGAFQCSGNAMDRLEKNFPEAYQDFIKNRLPRGKMGRADEIIPLIEYLCSPSASMMAGSVVPIDGGEGHYY